MSVLFRRLGIGLVIVAFAIPGLGQSPSAVTPDPAPGQPEQRGSDQQSAPISPISTTPGDSGTANSDQASTFVFKKQVDEVVLHATVVDQAQRLATHLDRNAFSVFEDGAPQTITSFRREDVPVAIGILIDNSGSMRDKREQVNQAVLNLIRASNPRDEIFVVNFSQNPFLDQDFTSDIGLLEQALHRTTTQGSTALYDAIAGSLAHLKSNAQLEKKMLLVITDGRDNMSRETLQEVKHSLQERNGPALYAIGLMGSDIHSPGHDALQDLADASGGCAFFPESLNQVDQIAQTLAHDIRSQYTLSYKPSNQHARGSYHPIQVEAKSEGYGTLRVRTRTGYYTGEAVR